MMKRVLLTKYFRISVTDICNLRCYFCHNEGQSDHENSLYLSVDDIIWSAGAAIEIGFKKFKITGGEPTLRSDLTQIISGIKKIGAEDISLITNGIRLSEISNDLLDCGLNRINVSVYSFDAINYKNICNGQITDIEKTILGIDSAIKAGFSDIKLNFILNNYTRMEDFERVLDFAKERNLRVLLLPLLNYNVKQSDKIFSFKDLYDFVKFLGIKREEIISDNEGFKQRLILTNSGNQVLLRMDSLHEKKMFHACLSCPKKEDCLEGIVPLRLSSKGSFIPCLAKGISEIDVRSTILSRDKKKFSTILKNISEL